MKSITHKLAMAFESPTKPSFPTVYRSHQVRQRVSPTIQTVSRASASFHVDDHEIDPPIWSGSFLEFFLALIFAFSIK